MFENTTGSEDSQMKGIQSQGDASEHIKGHCAASKLRRSNSIDPERSKDLLQEAKKKKFPGNDGKPLQVFGV